MSLSIPPPLPLPTPDASAPAPAPSPTAAPTTGPQPCANCRKDGAALRCGICKKKAYCDRECQRKDWPFHKRICEKPKEPGSAAATPKPATPAADAGAASATSSSSSASSGAEAAPKPSPTASSSGGGGDVELDEDDLAAVAEVKRMGYRYHAVKRGQEELAAIGDIRPKLIGSSAGAAGEGSSTPAVAPAAAAAATPSTATATPTPVAASSSGGAKSAVSSASAWNASGNTVEERDLTPWARSRLKELLRESRGELVVPLPGVGRLEVSGITGWGASTFDILISRGKTKYIYDLHVGFVAELVTDAAAAADAAAGAGSAEPLVASGGDLRDEAEDGDDASSGGDKKKAADGGSKKGAAASSAGASASSRKKQPRAIVRFPDVSIDSEGGDREVRVEWGKPAPADDTHDMIRSALHNAGVVTALRRVVEALVAEFKTK